MLISRRMKDIIAHRIMFLITVIICVIFFIVIVGLYIKSSSIIEADSLVKLLFDQKWYPFKGEFGFYPFILGTFIVTTVALIISIPLSLFTSIYLSEYAHEKVRELIRPLIDLLAAIPSVIYGVWGVLLIVPLIKDYIAPLFGVYSSGYCVMSAGLVLAIMVFPIIISITEEVLKSVPQELREASLSIGATKWQTIKHVVLRKAMPGIIAAIILGFARAFGETMAVMMLAGNVAKIPKSVFEPVYTLPALIANNYGEIMSVPLYESALMFAAFILLVVVTFFNLISRIILIRIERKIS